MDATARDLRVCFAGDSFVQGVCDQKALGWTGRLVAAARDRGHDLTGYNLGVRLDTSADVAERWYAEAAHRLRHGDAHAMVFSFGTNDVRARPDGAATERSLISLDAILDTAHGAGWPVFVVGLPPVRAEGADRVDAEPAQARLERAFAGACASRSVPFVPLHAALAADPRWWRSVDAGDGVHCDAEGYRLIADIVAEPWWTWLATL